jgi:DNA-binding MarR family transcriptional regulator
MQDKKTIPFVDDYLGALLAQASQLISSEFHKVVLRDGFSVNEWRVLASLYGIEEMSVGRLADVSVIKQPTVTRLLYVLEKKGVVARVVGQSDRRVTFVRITPKGEKIIALLIKQAQLYEQRVLKPFGAARAKELKILLREISSQHRTAR